MKIPLANGQYRGGFLEEIALGKPCPEHTRPKGGAKYEGYRYFFQLGQPAKDAPDYLREEIKNIQLCSDFKKDWTDIRTMLNRFTTRYCCSQCGQKPAIAPAVGMGLIGTPQTGFRLDTNYLCCVNTSCWQGMKDSKRDLRLVPLGFDAVLMPFERLKYVDAFGKSRHILERIAMKSAKQITDVLLDIAGWENDTPLTAETAGTFIYTHEQR